MLAGLMCGIVAFVFLLMTFPRGNTYEDREAAPRPQSQSSGRWALLACVILFSSIALFVALGGG
jgi:ABC-type Fe3+ transport system permease subunit